MKFTLFEARRMTQRDWLRLHRQPDWQGINARQCLKRSVAPKHGPNSIHARIALRAIDSAMRRLAATLNQAVA